MALCWQGIKDGIITPERLDEAVTRILATKAALGLHRGAPELDVEKAKTIVGLRQAPAVGRGMCRQGHHSG